MTNKEAIKHFIEQLEIFGDGEHREAMETAIEALKAQDATTAEDLYLQGFSDGVSDGILRAQQEPKFPESGSNTPEQGDYHSDRTTDDCISRQAAIDAIPYPIERLIKDIRAIPSVDRQGGWIPLNAIGGEPADKGEYLVCFDDGFIATTYYDGQDFELWADAGEPVAWMPLPEPYEEADE